MYKLIDRTHPGALWHAHNHLAPRLYLNRHRLAIAILDFIDQLMHPLIIAVMDVIHPRCWLTMAGLPTITPAMPFFPFPLFSEVQFQDMSTQNNHKAALLAITLLLLLGACSRTSGPSLPLETYHDPQERYNFAIPEGWESVVDDQTLTITPPDYSGTEEELIVRVYTSPTNTTDTATHIDLAKKEIEPFLSTYIEDDYEVVNEGDTRVDKYPAMLLDFAKPHEDSYMLGRVVIVAMPFYVLVFLGTGVEAEWEAFLPTFRDMLKEFSLVTPIEPED